MNVIPIRVDVEITTSVDLAGLLVSNSDSALCEGDILVVAQKAVSKQEGRMISLASVVPSDLAVGIASQYGKDPRIVEIILGESARIVRMRDGVIIVETNAGVVCANAGVDESNVPLGYATLLPENSDASARRLQARLLDITSLCIPVIISDTFGRPFRMGQTDCAIGVAGLHPVSDYAGTADTFGRALRVTEVAVADELASAAEIVMGKTGMSPAAIIRDYNSDHIQAMRDSDMDCGSRPLLRMYGDDLFR